MVKHKQFLALALAASMGVAASGAVSAQGMQQGQGMQGGMGHGMMGGGQGGMGSGMMMGGQSGMNSGMMMGGQGGMMPCPMMSGMGGMSGMAGMLDEEQQNSLREMRQEHRTSHFERMAEMMNLRDDMMLLMQAERPDPEEVKALHGQMATLHGEMMADKVRMHNQMQDLLTDEQREQMKQGASSRKSQQ
ncbi:Spy/CpxP family protein refolding chaperone [Halomonas korlensis]|uniref:Heavy-metal resistance n=1 Tax=Halomonas korlensis TaxID=463301 RepID=A0A1I7KFG4_9GAMM|nr:Spy/CpxP family protein refolding chaperone [Halomonas korlensis]SFU96182.1 Heavy-metal resistance [Halomonas korlensis]